MTALTFKIQTVNNHIFLVWKKQTQNVWNRPLLPPPPLAGSLSQAMDVGTHQTYIENRIGGNGYKLETTLNQEEVLMSDNTRKALLPKFRQNL